MKTVLYQITWQRVGPLVALLMSQISIPSQLSAGPDYLDTSIENASPLWYENTADNLVLVHLLYDQERGSSNRAAGHVHFLIHGKPGARFVLEFTNLYNVYNGKPGSVAPEMKTLVVSPNGRDWKSVATSVFPNGRVRLELEMPGPQLYVARIEPYRLSDLERLFSEIKALPMVRISPIGRTVEGRPLEIVQVGRPQAPWRVFIRARAHPWESGGNWVIEGLIRRLLNRDAQAREFLRRYCLYVMPMANKDGVARGRTRFNLQGQDLNRGWNEAANARWAPENAALEAWLTAQLRNKQGPHLALELHNDGSGKLHISRCNSTTQARYEKRMETLEALLRQHTWFTEGHTQGAGVGTLADGWLNRYGIDAAVHELHCNWIAGLSDYPTGRYWMDYGASLATVFYEYFGKIQP